MAGNGLPCWFGVPNENPRPTESKRFFSFGSGNRVKLFRVQSCWRGIYVDLALDSAAMTSDGLRDIANR